MVQIAEISSYISGPLQHLNSWGEGLEKMSTWMADGENSKF